MGKNKYTDLDKLFQSKLSEGRIESGEWNDPTDDAFFSAMRKVNSSTEQVKEKKKLAWWPFLFLFLIPLSLLVIWNANEVNGLKTEIKDIQQKESVYENSQNTTIALSNNINQTSQGLPIEAEGQVKIRDNKNKSTESIQAKSGINDDNKLVNSSRDHGKRVQKPLFTSVNNSITSKQALPIGPITVGFGKENIEKEIRSVSGDLDKRIKQLAPTLINRFDGLLIYNRAPVLLSSTEINLFNEDKGFKKFELFLFGNASFNTIRMSDVESNSFSLTGYDKPNLGYELGVGLLHSISERFSINYDLSYKHIGNNSQFRNEFLFEEEELVTDIDGDLVYQLFSELQTPTGLFTANQDLRFEGGNMEDQTMMDQEADIKLQFKFLSIGIQPRWKVYNSQRLSIFAEGGVNLNYLMHYCRSVDIKVYYQNKMMMNGAPEDDFSMSSLNRVSVAASLSLGMEYSFANNYFTSMQLGTSRSLNSINQLSLDGSKTYIDNAGISIAIGKKF